MVLRRGQLVVFAAERDDLVFDLEAGHLRDAVRLQTGARDQPPGTPRPLARVDGDLRRALADCGDCCTELDGSTGAADHLAHRTAHPLVIDDAGANDEERTDAGDVRLAAFQFAGVEPFSRRCGSASPARPGASMRWSSRSFVATRSFPQTSKGIPCAVQNSLVACAPRLAEISLQASRRVVDSRVDDTAVVTRLVQAQAVFLVEDDDARTGMQLSELHGGGKTDDPATDDAIVVDHACDPAVADRAGPIGTPTHQLIRAVVSVPPSPACRRRTPP